MHILTSINLASEIFKLAYLNYAVNWEVDNIISAHMVIFETYLQTRYLNYPGGGGLNSKIHRII